jgi:hypothetical protein
MYNMQPQLNQCQLAPASQHKVNGETGIQQNVGYQLLVLTVCVNKHPNSRRLECGIWHKHKHVATNGSMKGAVMEGRTRPVNHNKKYESESPNQHK